MESGTFHPLSTSTVENDLRKTLTLSHNSDDITNQLNNQAFQQTLKKPFLKLENASASSYHLQRKVISMERDNTLLTSPSNVLSSRESLEFVKQPEKLPSYTKNKKLDNGAQIKTSYLTSNHKSEEELLEEWKMSEGPKIVEEALSELKLNPSKIDEIRLWDMSQNELLDEKKNVGNQLKRYQSMFENVFGRKPNNEEKHPMGSLYGYYKKLDNQLKKLSGTDNSLKEFLKSNAKKSITNFSSGLAKTGMKHCSSDVQLEMEKTIGKANVQPLKIHTKGSNGLLEHQTSLDKTKKKGQIEIDFNSKSTLCPDVILCLKNNKLGKQEKGDALHYKDLNISIKSDEEKIISKSSQNTKSVCSMSNKLHNYNEIQQKIALLKDLLKP